ncbi:Hsp70 family protein [Dactylosporangium cerinum]
MTTNTVRLGVDFGTSNTVAVLRRGAGLATPLLFDSSPLLVSGVFVGAAGDVLTGADAQRAATAYPAGYEANPKRRIDDGAVWLGELEMPVRALVEAVLRRVMAEAERVVGAAPVSAVLTHPAAWSRTRLALLSAAARDAGIAEVGFLAEPVAAAAYFATVLGHEVPEGQCLVVYDLGAGTFDVSVVRRLGDRPEVIASDGLADVGGLDLDAAVVNHARSVTSPEQSAWGRLDWPAGPADQRAHQTLWSGARAAKEQLSRHTKADIHVPLVDADVHLTRDEFESAARPYLDRTVMLTLNTLRSAGVRHEQVAGVFLVGGSSRIPLVASLLHRALRIAPTVIDQPELVVAIGSLHIDPTPAPAEPTPSANHLPPAPVSPGPIPARAAPLAAPTTALAAEAAPAPAAAPSASDADPAVPAPGEASSTTAVVSAAPQPDTPAAPAAVGVTAATALTGGSAVPPPSTSTTLDAAPTGDATPSRRRRLRVVIAAAVAVVVLAGVFAAVELRDRHRQQPGGAGARSTSSGPAGPVPAPSLVLTGHTERINAVTWSPDSETIATAGTDHTIRLWNATTGQPVTTLTGHMASVFGLVYSPDGRSIVSVGGDAMRAWNAATGEQIGPYDADTSGIARIAFSPDGSLLATANIFENGIRLWNPTTRKQVREIVTEPARERALVYHNTFAFKGDSTTIATGGVEDGPIQFWSVSTGTKSAETAKVDGSVDAVRYTPDGANLVAVSNDYPHVTVTVHNVPGGELKTRLQVGDAYKTGSYVFSPDGRLIATTSRDGSITIWSIASGERTGPQIQPSCKSTAVEFSPDATMLAVGCEDGTTRLWSTSAAK